MHICLIVFPSWGEPQKNIFTLPLFSFEILSKIWRRKIIHIYLYCHISIHKFEVSINYRNPIYQKYQLLFVNSYVGNTCSQFGRPACVLVCRPVIKSRLSFLWIRSRAICRPTPLMSVLSWAAVMNMCISIIFSVALISLHSSISMWFSSPKNHSNDFCSRFIQIKSTYNYMLLL